MVLLLFWCCFDRLASAAGVQHTLHTLAMQQLTRITFTWAQTTWVGFMHSHIAAAAQMHVLCCGSITFKPNIKYVTSPTGSQ